MTYGVFHGADSWKNSALVNNWEQKLMTKSVTLSILFIGLNRFGFLGGSTLGVMFLSIGTTRSEATAYINAPRDHH